MMDIHPEIKLPLSTSALKDAILDHEPCLNHNYVQDSLVIAGGMMSFYYRPVVSLFGGCSLTMATGLPAKGKTSAVKAFLGAISSTRSNMSITSINQALWEKAPFYFVPFGIDDPSDKKEKIELEQPQYS